MKKRLQASYCTSHTSMYCTYEYEYSIKSVHNMGCNSLYKSIIYAIVLESLSILLSFTNFFKTQKHFIFTLILNFKHYFVYIYIKTFEINKIYILKIFLNFTKNFGKIVETF